ncbi:MAG: hypothetical protein P4L83_24570 [Nevskia sp.]|nr:hypothetical protein [Nevskia sp.]
MTGYSGSPLARKLGIKPDSLLLPVNAPDGYLQLLDPLPPGVRFGTRLTQDTDMVHLFTTSRQELQDWLDRCRARLRPTAVAWVSWPKRTAGKATEVTEHTIREAALPLGLVDVKVCAVSDRLVGPEAGAAQGASLIQARAVTPAKAGVQRRQSHRRSSWIPAYAGMTSNYRSPATGPKSAGAVRCRVAAS